MGAMELATITFCHLHNICPTEICIKSSVNVTISCQENDRVTVTCALENHAMPCVSTERVHSKWH